MNAFLLFSKGCSFVMQFKPCVMSKNLHLGFELDQLSYTKEIPTPSSLKPLRAITNYR